ncbi:MAG: hypothetical protein RLZZ15_3949 [Verrucomicrobiota bacterium]|jgi:uncharacterized protein (DUF433 family)
MLRLGAGPFQRIFADSPAAETGEEPNLAQRQRFDSVKSPPTVLASMMTASAFPHIVLDAPGVAWVDETNTKVREIVLDVIAHGWSPKEIHLHHPHLALAQIHAALAYYYDHKLELDAEIETALRSAESLRAAAGESPLRQRLLALRRAS